MFTGRTCFGGCTRSFRLALYHWNLFSLVQVQSWYELPIRKMSFSRIGQTVSNLLVVFERHCSSTKSFTVVTLLRTFYFNLCLCSRFWLLKILHLPPAAASRSLLIPPVYVWLCGMLTLSMANAHSSNKSSLKTNLTFLQLWRAGTRALRTHRFYEQLCLATPRQIVLGRHIRMVDW